ncbi:MAG TPA: PTS fructose transporter subunit IIA [Ruminococcaceae bacterium]|nr:PTS fructose transporter subunit IIA [Oscillospiraceae bacterium]
MDISSIINKDIIFLDLKASNRDDVLNTMIDGMDASGYIIDKDKYFNAVTERESKSSTAIGFGVAIPHGKSAGIGKACVAFARLHTPIKWNPQDEQPVATVFLIGVPQQNEGNEHLKILIAISKKLIHEDFRNALAKAKTADDIIDVLKSI